MKKNIPYIILIFLLFGSIVCNIILAVNNTPKSPSSIFDDNKYSIVELKAYSENVGESHGTAEFISEDGLLITNAHVITYKQMGSYHTFDSISIRFSFEENYKDVELVKYDTDKDLAVLSLIDKECKFRAISIGDNKQLKYGDTVYAIGNLNNMGLCITQGTVSNPSINVSYDNNVRNVIQCNLTIADGNSGGSLLDKNGKLIGITTFRLKDSQNNVIYGISYCVTIASVLEYIENN